MEDIVERLRNISGEAGDQGDVVLCTDAAEEIERLRQRVHLWERCATKTVQMYGGCVRPEYEQRLEDAAVSMAGLVRLTAEDRDTLQFAANMIQRDVADASDGKRRADATGLVKDLRRLLKRAAL